MAEVTKEQIQRLETVGLKIIDNIFDEYNLLNDCFVENTEIVRNLYVEFGEKMKEINREVSSNGN